VGRGTGIAQGVVKDEVFEMHQFAVDPEGGTRVCEIVPFEEAGANR